MMSDRGEAATGTAESLGELTACPECGALAEVTEVVALGSTDGPIDHARVRCVRRHWFFMPADRLVRSETSEPMPSQRAR